MYTEKMRRSLYESKTPGMTRRHFEFIAAALRASRPAPGATDEKFKQWDRTVVTFANRLEGTNIGFRRARFLSACRGEL